MKRAKCENKEEMIAPAWKNSKWNNDDPASEPTATPSPRKKCPEGCPDVELSICGSDGVTYGNPCELHVAACQHAELNIVEDSGEVCVGTKKTPQEE
ncbi:hypothetical protein PHYPSEUDO_011105 [Phytophthora pseudosyringae]|uniref:Kazal-like domain-containing protein n=1 Tax=Phytophthora pseudosyringae TaxID=221518 RepID=A0A8T1W6N4_9STRA|nr:hypothetical protein PHYPSEUDO_011105 [Phytophthora pseudosyringae]